MDIGNTGGVMEKLGLDYAVLLPNLIVLSLPPVSLNIGCLFG
jgi:hypothetical protein